MKKIRLLLLLACALSVWQMKGQTGLNCSNAIAITQPFTQTYSSGVSEQWYYFNATDTTLQCNVTQLSNQINVSKIEFYSGTCSTLNLLAQDSLTSPTDSVKSITESKLTVNNTYYIRVVFIDRTQKYDYMLSLAHAPLGTNGQLIWTDPSGTHTCLDGYPYGCSMTICLGDQLCFAWNYASGATGMFYWDTFTFTGGYPTLQVPNTFNNPAPCAVFTPTAAGTYSVICGMLQPFTVIVLPHVSTPLYAISPSNPVCLGECVTFTPLNTDAINESSSSNDPYVPCMTGTPPQPLANTYNFSNAGINHIIYSLNAGTSCAQTFTFPVIVNTPSITVTHTMSLCALTGTFNASLSCNSIGGGTNFLWNIYAGSTTGTSPIFTDNNGFNNTINYTFPSTGTYVVECIYYINNLPITTTQTINVTAPPTPIINVSPAPQSICIGSCETFTASGALTYIWSTAVTTPTITLCPTVTTTYYVKGTNACGITGVTYFSVGVYPPQTPITVSANPNPICLGASSTILALGANSYTWAGGNIGATQSNNIPVTPTVTTTYTVIGSNGICASTQSAVITVTVNSTSLSTFSIVTPSLNICANGTGTNTVLFSTSLASTAGLTFTWNPTAVHTPTANIDISQSTIVTVTVANTCSVTQIQSVNINYVASTCCTNTTAALNSFTVNNTTINNQTFKVAANQTITLNGTVIYNNCDFLMGTNSAIIALPTVTLSLNNCKLYSCEGMWQGIVLQHNGNQSAKIYVRNSNIEDAFNGINSDYPINTFQLTSLINVSTTSVFNKNYKDIVITYAPTNTAANTGVYPLMFMDSKMISQASTTSPGTNLKISNYYSPIIINHSNTGLYTENAGIITFTYTGASNNLVKNKDYGLYFRKTSATVWNVDFKDMTGYLPNIATCIGCPPPAPVVPLGIAIASGNAKFLFVKPPTGTVVNTTFNNIGYGIVTNKTANVEVTYCDFNNTGQYSSLTGYSYGAMGVWSLDASSYLRVDYNSFNKTYTPVTVNYSVIPTPSTYTMSVSNNIMTAGSGVLTTGVMVQGATPFYNVLGSMAVAHNSITNAYTGIKVMSITSGLRVSNNSISLKNATQNTGIYLAGNNNGLMVDNNSINGNLIPAANAANYSIYSYGIRSDLSPNCFIQCNNITRVGRGIAYNGNNSTGNGTGAELFKNMLAYPIKQGLVLMNGGIVGTQGNSGGASANVWNGFPLNSTTDQTVVGATPYPNPSDAINSILWVRNIAGTNAQLPTDNNYSLPSVPSQIYSLTSSSIFTVTAGDVSTCPNALTQGFKVAITPVLNTAQRNADYSNYITTVVSSSSSATTEAKWMLKQHMHKAIRKTSIGTDVTVASFYTAQQNADVASYYEIDSLFSIGDVTTAQGKNAVAPITNNLTQTHHDYNAMYVSGVTTSSDYATLQTIANLCPYIYGNGVYQARALLNMTSYSNIDYNDSCSDVSDKRIGRPADEGQGVSVAENISANLYPNPNNGTFVLAYNIDKESDVDLLVTDISGKLIYKASLDVLANLKSISATDFENGIYFARLINGVGKLLWTEKVVISK